MSAILEKIAGVETPAGNFLAKNFADDVIKLQRGYEEALETPAKMDKFIEDATQKFREMFSKYSSGQPGPKPFGLAFSNADGSEGWRIGTRDAGYSDDAFVNITALSATIEGVRLQGSAAGFQEPTQAAPTQQRTPNGGMNGPS